MGEFNLYTYRCYRKCIRDLIELKKESDPTLTVSRLADRIQVQRSYLSRVLSGKGSLNADQLFLLTRELNLTVDQARYLQLLMEIERCQVPERKAQLEARREAILKKKQQSETYLGRKAISPADLAYSEYYTNALCPISHMLLTLPDYQKKPQLIAERLRITPKKLSEILSVLERCGLIRFQKDGLELVSHTLHVSADSHLSKAYATQFRLKAIEFQQRSDNGSDYFFTSSFTANEEIRAEFKRRFLELLKWLSRQVEECEPQELFHLNLDLFRL